MSAALLTFMSAMPAMSYSSSLEIEPDAGLADPPHTADAMAEGDSADAVAKVALAAVSLHFGGKKSVTVCSMMVTYRLGCGSTLSEKIVSCCRVEARMYYI